MGGCFCHPSCSALVCGGPLDRKSTRLNSSHLVISYAVFCLKKKKNYESMVDVMACARGIYTSAATFSGTYTIIMSHEHLTVLYDSQRSCYAMESWIDSDSR